MTDHFPSLTAGDINQAAELLGLFHQAYEDYPADVKADLVNKIRRIIRTVEMDLRDAGGMATDLHPALVELVEKADRDWPVADFN
jgi:hypothetical protein